MWAAHHDRHACGTNGVGHAICARYHSGHRTDADQPDLLRDDELHKFLFIHGAGVAVNQEHFMAGRRARFK